VDDDVQEEQHEERRRPLLLRQHDQEGGQQQEQPRSRLATPPGRAQRRCRTAAPAAAAAAAGRLFPALRLPLHAVLLLLLLLLLLRRRFGRLLQQEPEPLRLPAQHALAPLSRATLAQRPRLVPTIGRHQSGGFHGVRSKQGNDGGAGVSPLLGPRLSYGSTAELLGISATSVAISKAARIGEHSRFSQMSWISFGEYNDMRHVGEMWFEY
jgi:hypothetical protein